MSRKLAKGGLALDSSDDMKRAPAEFAGVVDPLAAAAVRKRHFVCRRPFADARLGEADLVGDMVAFARDARPLLDWGWDGLTRDRESGVGALP